MVPFLRGALPTVILELLRIFVKTEVIASAQTVLQLIKIDVKKRENLIELSKIELDTGTKAALREARVSDSKMGNSRRTASKPWQLSSTSYRIAAH